MKIKLLLLFALLATAQHAAANTIYRCDQPNGSVSLQQSPCTTGETQQTYAFPERKQAPSTRGPAPLPQRKPVQQYQYQERQQARTSERASAVGKRLTQCRKLWNREQDLRDTEREGYTAKEGEQIRRKLRRIKRDKKLLRCNELKP